MPTPTSLIPENDPLRVIALRTYSLLGTAPDAVFDEIVRLTAKLFKVPVALVSLVDEDNVEFLANFGLEAPRTVARADSICSVAVLNDGTTVFEDLHANPCLLTNPYAAQQLNLGFYAGHALKTDEGHNIGSLCIIDHKARLLSEAESRHLTALAAVAMDLIDLRHNLQQHPDTAMAMWLLIYRSIESSLLRIDTLRELLAWEEAPTTEAAIAYQRSLDEEADLIVQLLNTQINAAKKRLR